MVTSLYIAFSALVLFLPLILFIALAVVKTRERVVAPPSFPEPEFNSAQQLLKSIGGTAAAQAYGTGRKKKRRK